MYLPSDAETNGSLKTFDDDKLGPTDDAFDHERRQMEVKGKIFAFKFEKAHSNRI